MVVSTAKFNIILGAIWFIAAGVLVPVTALAHRSGCHNLHTCPSDSNSYVCGDLGYPCTGATKIDDINPATIHVPLLTEAAFKEIFGRVPTDAESTYWKKRFRAEKNSVHKLRRAMGWHKANGSFGPPAAVLAKENLASKVNALFRSVYGRDPTVSENRYWLSRLKDKPYEHALVGAMAHHKAHNVQH